MRHADTGDTVRSTAGSYRPHLDGLRCLAVYLVVAFHAGLGGFRGGFIGVDIFFVLSGYLVTRLLLRDLAAANRIDFRNFYARRFRRILPASAVALIVTAVAYAAIASPFQSFDAVAGFRAAFVYIANWHFIAQATDYFATNVNASPVLHFWSLAVEEQFYFVWPLLLSGLYLVSRRVGRHQWWVLRSFILLAAFASAIAALHIGRTDLNRAYYGTDTRAYQLLAGALIAVTPQVFTLGARFVRSARWTAAVCAVGLLAVGSSAFTLMAIWRGVATVAFTFGLIIALEVAPTGAIRRVLSRPSVAYLGRISYATYLWHWPIVVLVALNYTAGPIALFAVSAVGATALAALSYRFIEHPIRSARALDSFRGPVIVAGLTVSLVAGLVIAPALLRRPSNATADVAALSVAAPGTTAGSATLLDWRVAKADGPAQNDCYRRPVKDCIVVRGTGASVLIMGDSTARMWLPTFTEIARRESLTLSIASFSGCPWQLGLDSGLTIPPGCVSHRNDWYARVVPQLHPDIVVVSEQDYDQPGRPFVVRYPNGTQILTTSPAGARILANASARSVGRLRAARRKIVLLGSAPADETANPMNCLSKGKHDCAFRVSPLPTPLDRYFTSLANRHDTFTLDLDRLACPRFPVCDPVINDIVVRRDYLHLTATYARAIAPSVDELLHSSAILPSRSNAP